MNGQSAELLYRRKSMSFLRYYRGVKLDFVKVKEICDMYCKGYNIQDLVKIFHSTKKSISRVLKNNNINIQRNRRALL